MLSIAISYIYDEVIRDDEKNYFYACEALERLSHIENNPDFSYVEIAKYINGLAYSLCHINPQNIKSKGNFDIKNCIETAHDNLLHALKKINYSIKKDGSNKLKQVIRAKIYGNLGAYWLAKSKLENICDSEKINSLYNAIDNHKISLEIRKKYKLKNMIATSYACLAIDNYYLNDYNSALDFWGKVFQLNEKGKNFEHLIRASGCYTKLLTNQYVEDDYKLLLNHVKILINMDSIKNNVTELENLKKLLDDCINIYNNNYKEISSSDKDALCILANKVNTLYNDNMLLHQPIDLIKNIKHN